MWEKVWCFLHSKEETISSAMLHSEFPQRTQDSPTKTSKHTVETGELNQYNNPARQLPKIIGISL